METLTRRSLLTGALMLELSASLLCSGESQQGYRAKPHRGAPPTPITWILHGGGSDAILGKQPVAGKVEPLESLVFTQADPRTVSLSDWDLPTLTRLVPIKRIIERNANHHSINPVWATMFFNYESLLNPSDVNHLSDDYGLGQIKRGEAGERLAKRLGTNPASRLYSPELDAKKGILDPQTNIAMAMLLHRYNIERYGLTDSNQVYAVYVRGLPGLNRDGSLNALTRDKLTELRNRFTYLEKIVPLFRLGSQPGNAGEDAAFLLDLYAKDTGPEAAYRAELDHFLPALEKGLQGDVRSVMVYDDCVLFANALHVAYANDMREQYARLERISARLAPMLRDEGLRLRVKDTIERLKDHTAARGRGK